MGSLHETNPSLWVTTTSGPHYPVLDTDTDTEVDVAVIGAGITGLTTARLLAGAGPSVAVIEAGRVCSGVTGYTTAKITSLHRLIYRELIDRHGEARAAAYADANQAAITRIADLAAAGGIGCELETAEAFTYTDDDGEVGDIEAEVEAARRLGLPARFMTETDLPFPVKAAVAFDGQAQFHPRKYCLGLAQGIVSAGGRVHEHTRAVGVDDSNGRCVVHTERATIYRRPGGGGHPPSVPRRRRVLRPGPPVPVLRHRRVPGRTGPRRDVHHRRPARALAAPHRRRLAHRRRRGPQDRPGRRHPSPYQALGAWCAEVFPGATVTHRWSAQDYESVDGMPYVGRSTPGQDRILVATGFRKWGMTNGTAAAVILADLIMGRDNPWAEAYDSTRLAPGASITSLVTENLNVGKRLVGDRLRSLRPGSADRLAPGEGGTVDLDGEKVAAFRDDTGRLHAVTAKCTHLGCLVTFNTAERSWDCPCHGSRFDVDGRVIAGPATADLEVRHPSWG